MGKMLARFFLVFDDFSFTIYFLVDIRSRGLFFLIPGVSYPPYFHLRYQTLCTSIINLTNYVTPKLLWGEGIYFPSQRFPKPATISPQLGSSKSNIQIVNSRLIHTRDPTDVPIYSKFRKRKGGLGVAPGAENWATRTKSPPLPPEPPDENASWKHMKQPEWTREEKPRSWNYWETKCVESPRRKHEPSG